MTPEEAVYRQAIRLTIVVLAAIAVVGAAIAWVVVGPAGAVAALVGAVVAAIGAIPTQVSMLVGHRKPPHVMAGIVAFSWLGKMAVIIVALLVLGQVESFHRASFAATAMTGIVASLVVDVLTLRKARIPYVEPGP
ncbi:hypothetical protein [Demequina mangrovi]|uniref:ATP synthase protein I n=1 Tax=Demequina mangrovi TaxID=1043493 RepID=A0A1H6X2N7_9MICO|nr:hypothetical protein [Demequina mangrovi]SEJ22396.1 hypothetical protein SAMN05421637_1218 [Demequina mangrovi]